MNNSTETPKSGKPKAILEMHALEEAAAVYKRDAEHLLEARAFEHAEAAAVRLATANLQLRDQYGYGMMQYVTSPQYFRHARLLQSLAQYCEIVLEWSKSEPSKLQNAADGYADLARRAEKLIANPPPPRMVGRHSFETQVPEAMYHAVYLTALAGLALASAGLDDFESASSAFEKCLADEWFTDSTLKALRLFQYSAVVDRLGDTLKSEAILQAGCFVLRTQAKKSGTETIPLNDNEALMSLAQALLKDRVLRSDERVFRPVLKPKVRSVPEAATGLKAARQSESAV